MTVRSALPVQSVVVPENVRGSVVPERVHKPSAFVPFPPRMLPDGELDVALRESSAIREDAMRCGAWGK